MSGTGSLMIRNLRKPGDYSKAVMTQDELIRIAIANDANVAGARAGFQRGEVAPLSAQELKSPAEIQADQALQEKTALNNLLKLFQYREASSIIGLLNPNELFVMNTTFPQIERDIKSKFEVGFLTPTFFVEYLRKWIEELDASKGVSTNLSSIQNKFDALTDNINDMRAIIPTQAQFTMLGDYLEGEIDRLPRIIVAPLLDRILRLQDSIPTAAEYRKVSQDQEVLQFETLVMLQQITANMPTQNQLNMIMEDIRSGRVSSRAGLKAIEDAISGVSDEQLDMLEDIKREIAQSSVSGAERDISIEAQVSVPIASIPILALAKRVKSGTPGGAVGLYIIYLNGRSEEVDSAGLARMIRSNEGFKDWYATKIGGAATLSNLKNYIRAQTASVSASSSTATSQETTGFGLKAKNGKIVTTKKIGKGVSFEPEPTYRQLGKYVINMPQLKERDILNVKFPSLGRIPQFKPTPISDVLKEFILELLDTGKVSNRIYDQIPTEERQLFERIATGAGIIHNLKLKRTVTDEDKADNDRFTLLKGEYLAGNNSVALLKELRKLVVKFMSQSKISKNDGMNLLIELSV